VLLDVDGRLIMRQAGSRPWRTRSVSRPRTGRHAAALGVIVLSRRDLRRRLPHSGPVGYIPL
jgi:hypothetical protein